MLTSLAAAAASWFGRNLTNLVTPTSLPVKKTWFVVKSDEILRPVENGKELNGFDCPLVVG